MIKTFFHIYPKIKYLKKVFKKYKKSLAFGNYYLYPCLRATTLKQDDFTKEADKYFNNMPFQQNYQFAVNFINKFGCLKNKESCNSEYQAIYIANNSDVDREVKLFSFTKKKILTICKSAEEQNKQIELYSALHKSYHLPAVAICDTYDYSYTIDMVQMLPSEDNKSAILEIAECTKKFNKSNAKKQTREILKYSYQDNRFQTVLNKIVKNISNQVLDASITICPQHGDLSSENLIYGKSNGRTGYWWIDWEHIKDRVFYYDIFFYIQHSAFYFNNKSILQEFLCGEYDLILNDLFSHFGHTYIPERRKEYFCVFLIAFFSERLCDKGYYEALINYYDFMDKNGVV